MLKRTLLSGISFLILGINAWAQGVSPAQMGITPTTLPEVLQVLDNTGAWVKVGTVDPSTHTFTPVIGATYPDHATLVSNVTTAPFAANIVTQLGYYNSGDNGRVDYIWNSGSFCQGGTSTTPTPADQVTCILPSGQAATQAGRYIIQLPGNIATSAMFGMVGDTVTSSGTPGTDNSPMWVTFSAFQQAGAPNLAQSPGSNGWTFKFGPGGFYFSTPLELHAMTRLLGQTPSPNNYNYPTQLVFPNNMLGILIAYQHTCYQYGYDVTRCPPGDAAGSYVADLALQPIGGPGLPTPAMAQTALYPKAFGVWMRTRAAVENLSISYFANDGLHAAATSGSADTDLKGLMSQWSAKNIIFTENWGNGLFTHGGDVSVAQTERLQGFCNAGFLIRDESFFGMVHTTPLDEADGAIATCRPLGSFQNIAVTTRVNYAGFAYELAQSGWTTDNGTTGNFAKAQHIPPSATGVDTTYWHVIGPAAPGPTTPAYPQWGQVVETISGTPTVCTVIPGQEATMWQNDPQASPTIWNCGGGAPNYNTTVYIDWALASAQVNLTAPYTPDPGAVSETLGPYIAGGGFRNSFGNSVWVGPYTESNWGYSHMPTATVLGSSMQTNGFSPTGIPASGVSVATGTSHYQGQFTFVGNNYFALTASTANAAGSTTISQTAVPISLYGTPAGGSAYITVSDTANRDSNLTGASGSNVLTDAPSPGAPGGSNGLLADHAVAGLPVTGTCIPASTTVSSVSGNTVTLSNNLTCNINPESVVNFNVIPTNSQVRTVAASSFTISNPLAGNIVAGDRLSFQWYTNNIGNCVSITPGSSLGSSGTTNPALSFDKACSGLSTGYAFYGPWNDWVFGTSWNGSNYRYPSLLFGGSDSNGYLLDGQGGVVSPRLMLSTPFTVYPTPGAERLLDEGTAAPTQAWNLRGNIHLNSAPTPSSNLAWADVQVTSATAAQSFTTVSGAQTINVASCPANIPTSGTYWLVDTTVVPNKVFGSGPITCTSNQLTFTAANGTGFVSNGAADALSIQQFYPAGVIAGDTGGNQYTLNAIISTGTKPTNSGSCAINTQVGGMTAGSFRASGVCATNGTIVLAMPTGVATNGWRCPADDMTTPANPLKVTAYTTSSVTLTATAGLLASDQISFGPCVGF